MPDDRLVATLHHLADEADALTLAPWQEGTVVAENKADGSVVTAIDRAVETRLRSTLLELHPGDAFLGEEVGGTAAAQRTWIVDGIDGTRFYARGDRAWSTLIALVIDGSAVAGMVTSPALERRWWTDGQAAWTSTNESGRAPLVVSAQPSLDHAAIGVWPWEGRPRDVFVDQWSRLGTWPTQDQLRPSAGTGVPNGAMLVADGRADGFVMFGGQPWDHAANVAIVRAAGGQFSCLDGTDSMSTGAGVYSNGLVHEDLLTGLDAAR